MIHPVPGAGRRLGLLPIEPLGKVHVETQEVDQLARTVDLGLVSRLALAEHGGRVHQGAIPGGEQIRRFEKHGGPVLESPMSPVLLGFDRGVHRLADQLGGSLVHVREDPGVTMGCGDRLGVAGTDFPASDHDGDLLPIRGDGLQCRLERGAVGAPRLVGEDGIVARNRELGWAAHATRTWPEEEEKVNRRAAKRRLSGTG